jgi:hypothetical protein
LLALTLFSWAYVDGNTHESWNYFLRHMKAAIRSNSPQFTEVAGSVLGMAVVCYKL